jgi:photosystem II stability/assembly factor-like uncharacterized protein
MAKRISLLVAVFTLAATSLAFSSGGSRALAWELRPTGADGTRLRGLSVVSEKVVWTSGGPDLTSSTPASAILRTTNSGRTWQSLAPPGTTELEFRDIHAFDRQNAVVLAAGGGTDARVYVTSDGGRTWHLGFQNTDPDPLVFYDCMTFFDRRHGLALSDPVGGRFRIIATRDGGRSWSVVPADMPPALPNEFAFAASGQCLISTGDILGHHRGDDDDDDDRGGRKARTAWFATGGATTARVFRSRDGGRSWQAFATPVRSNDLAGIFALAFRDEHNGIAVGGDLRTPDNSPNSLALTRDGGRTWTLVAAEDAINEYRSSVHWRDKRSAIAVGPTGSDATFDRGRSWHGFDEGSFDTVECTDDETCWSSGTQGRVARLVTDEDD